MLHYFLIYFLIYKENCALIVGFFCTQICASHMFNNLMIFICTKICASHPSYFYNFYLSIIYRASDLCILNNK